MKKPYKQPVKKLTKEEWAKIDKEYSEDMNTQIAENKKDLNNWVNVVCKGVIIPLTTEELVAWDKLSRVDKRAMADSIKNKINSGAFEYFQFGELKLIRPTHERKN
jgi:hypothetical protein